MFKKLGLSMAAKTDAPSLFNIAITLGEIKSAQAIMLEQLGKSATREHLVALEADVDQLADVIRENHSNHDSRLRVLETTQSSLKTEQHSTATYMGKIMDAVFKVAVGLAILVIGAKQTGVLP